MVFFFHSQAPPEYPVIVMLQRQRWVGVEIFFALSAFLLFDGLEREQQQTGRIAIGLFYVRRVLRIYPLMLAFTAAMLVFYAGSQGPAAYGWLLGLAASLGNFIYWLPERAAIMYTGHLWSLSYEFQIYLILPLLFLAYRAVGKRAFVIALLCALPLCLLGRTAFALSGVGIQAIYMTPILRPESTIVGILVALGLTRQFPLPVVLGALVLSVLALFVLPGRQTPAGSVLVFVTTGILAGSMLHLALYAKTLGAVLSWPPLAGLGRISFGLYVFHLWAYVEGVRLLRLTPIPDSYTTRWLAGLTLCIVVATASYHLFERPITRMKPRAAALQPAAG